MTRYAVGVPGYVRIIRAVAKAFPDRCVLLQIKNATPYPFEDYRGLVSGDKRVIYDVIREDMGLVGRDGERAPG